MTLLLVGKTCKGWISDGLDIYRDRLGHYVKFQIKEIPELKGVSSFTKEQIKQQEGELVLKEIRQGDTLVLLDERGTAYSSIEFSRTVGKYLSSGKDVVFVIGGAYGFSKDVYSRAGAMISLSRMTFSHQMARVIFTEQLYRAFTIINGEPYHHE